MYTEVRSKTVLASLKQRQLSESTGAINAGLPGSRRLIFSLADKPGALTDALELLKKHGLNMNHIESRPSITAAHVYDFFVAIDGETATNEAIEGLIREVKRSGYGDVTILSESTTKEDESTNHCHSGDLIEGFRIPKKPAILSVTFCV